MSALCQKRPNAAQQKIATQSPRRRARAPSAARREGFAERDVMERRRDDDSLFRLDVGRADHIAPLFGFLLKPPPSRPVASLLSRPRYSGQTHFRAVHGDQVGHRGDRPDQANRDYKGDSHHPCAHLHRLYVALSLPIGARIFSPAQREVVHGCAKFFEATAEESKRNGRNVQTG